MPASSRQLRAPAIQLRRTALVEKMFYPKFKAELVTFATEAGQYMAEGGVERVANNMERHKDALQKIILDLFRVAGSVAFEYIQLQHGGKRRRMSKETKQEDPADMEEALAQLSLNWFMQSFSLSEAIAATSLDMVRERTVQLVREGVGEAVMSKEIMKFMEQASGWRARTIARTESHAAVQESQYEIIQSMDLDEYVKVWRTAGQRVRKSHQQADGQARFPQNTFRVGSSDLRFPGDRRGRPADIVNCRCVTTEDFDDVRERG